MPIARLPLLAFYGLALLVGGGLKAVLFNLLQDPNNRTHACISRHIWHNGG